MSNSIKITACDNQLILLAVNGSSSYEICNIQSGNYNEVTVDIDIAPGTPKTLELNGVNGPINAQDTVNIPSGTYSLVYVGINWGGPYNFDMTFNGQPYKLENNDAKPLTGAIWNRGNLDITFTV